MRWILLSALLAAGLSFAQPSAAAAETVERPPSQLWEEFPLDNGRAATPGTPGPAASSARDSSNRPTALRAPSGHSDLFTVVIVLLIAMLIAATAAFEARGSWLWRLRRHSKKVQQERAEEWELALQRIDSEKRTRRGEVHKPVLDLRAERERLQAQTQKRDDESRGHHPHRSGPTKKVAERSESRGRP